jgi:hypothetical protein
MFRRILRLYEPTLTFKNSEYDEFLEANNEGMELLERFLTSLTSDANATQVEVCSLRYPYKDFAWLFTRLIEK